jgi:formamidopyrimidine-DNA glycosylase
LVEIGRHQEAEASFKESIAVLTMDQREVEPWRIRTAKKSYADLLRRMGREKEAKDLESQIEAPVLQQSAPIDAPRPAVSGRA